MTIATATLCSCGSPVLVGPFHSYGFFAHCARCYDPCEDASPRALVHGQGPDSMTALWAWQDAHDEAHEVEWRPTAKADLFRDLERQITEESERQASWRSVAAREQDVRPEASPRQWGPLRVA